MQLRLFFRQIERKTQTQMQIYAPNASKPKAEQDKKTASPVSAEALSSAR
jgi:hypothetical protein